MADISRIKGNVSKMLAQSAPETDIDAYLKEEGVTPEQLRGEAPKKPSTYSLLPFRNTEEGGVEFDSNAGLLGSVKRAFTLPGEVMRGETAPDDIGRVTEMATLVSPLKPGVAQSLVTKAAVPTAKELQATGAADINAAKASGLELASQSASDYSRKVQQDLFNDGIHPIDAPATFAKLKALEDAPPGSVFTASNLQSLRRSLQGTAQNFNPQAASDQLAASRAIAGFDKYLPSIDPKDVLAGTPSATQALFERGRGNYAAAQRSNDINGTLDRATTGILERSEGRAQAANSGRNLDNTIRSKVESALEKPKEVSGYSDAELAALEGVRDGGPVRNTARYVGNLLGGGGGVGQSVIAALSGAGGFAAGGVPGALVGGVAPALVGSGSKAIANALAKRSLNKTDELIRTRSPLYEERLAGQGEPDNTAQIAAIIRALMASQTKPSQLRQDTY